MAFLYFFEPNIFSPIGTSIILLVAIWYWHGLRRLKAAGQPVALWRSTLFYLCWAGVYIVLETQFDYFAQFIFFMHRIQHLFLHHLLAFLIVISRPFPILNAGLGERFPRQFWLFRVLAAIVRRLMHPYVASLLFVGLIVFWLYPPVHLIAMLNYPLYITMNWSMLIDGLLFWPVMLDQNVARRLGFGSYLQRILGMTFTLLAQVVLGAYITFGDDALYRIYQVCGRPWPISPETDQVLGGIMTWIPPAMMAVIGILIIMRHYVREEEAMANARKQQREAQQ